MPLNKQMQIYSVDTSAFYTKEENKIHRVLNKCYFIKNNLIIEKTKNNKKLKNTDLSTEDIQKINDRINYLSSRISRGSKRIHKLKERMYVEFKENKNKIRVLNNEYTNDKNIVSIFDSMLTRTIGLKENKVSTELLIVQTYFFDVLEDIIKNGFIYNEEKYICFTASAGQIRTKKTVFIKEATLKTYENTLTCGLTKDDINSKGGMNINKYLAYLALCNSATDLWNGFNIDKTIVVEDFETSIIGEVDFIDDKDYSIKRISNMEVPIPHTDGCGMMLPKVSNKNMMTRIPWVKGLLAVFPFDKFIREKRKGEYKDCGIIKDIYGTEHDILKEGIEIIFTKSQFKMWKFYESWEEYKQKFKEFKCTAGICNVEEDKDLNKAKINYQMIQTLTDMTNKELRKISEKTSQDINNIGKDRDTMLNVLGVKKSNKNKNYIQQALEIYPELLNDTYSKEILKQVKKSMVKQAKSAKLEIDGYYTFLIPDLYAFCEWLFLHINNPKGLLEDKEVSCKLFDDGKKLDCLRSPHLYREHAIRKNIVNDKTKRWFTTIGIYTSCHDMISKILMFDVDGDKSLVCEEETLVNVAERNMKGIVPLYYNMSKAKAEIVNNDAIFKGLSKAYTGGNIGAKSNDITKIWNSKNPSLNVVKLLCMENNFTIDYAKTLYKPKRPNDVHKEILKYTKSKTPYFFIYAKDKPKDKVENINNSVVNRLNSIIPNPRINFNAENLGKFDYKNLMSKKDIELDNDIINIYSKLDLRKRFMGINSIIEEDSTNDDLFVYRKIREDILDINNDIDYVVNVLVEYLYNHKMSSYKTTLWSSFGDIIVKNLKENIKTELGKDEIMCNECGKRIKITTGNNKYCKKCAKKINIKNTIDNRKNKKIQFEADTSCNYCESRAGGAFKRKNKNSKHT